MAHKKNFVAIVMASFVFVLLVLALDAAWTRDNATLPSWNQITPWSTCTCRDIDEFAGCEEKRQHFNTVKAFSILELVFEVVAIGAFLSEAFLIRKNHRLVKIALLGYLIALAANIVTWTTFSAILHKSNFCSNQSSYDSQGFKLTWAFAIRLVELGGIVMMIALAVVSLFKRDGDVPICALPVAFFVLLMGIITTSGRGWMQNNDTMPKHYTYEIGLWDECQCHQVSDESCGTQRIRFKGVQTFIVVAIVAQFVLLTLLSAGSATYAALQRQRWLSIFTFGSILVSTALFTEIATTRVCGREKVTDSQNLYWGYAVECCALILSALTYLYLIWIVEDDAEAKKVDATEPTS